MIWTFDAKIGLHFSTYHKKIIRSNNKGYQYYNVSIEGSLNKKGEC